MYGSTPERILGTRIVVCEYIQLLQAPMEAFLFLPLLSKIRGGGHEKEGLLSCGTQTVGQLAQACDFGPLTALISVDEECFVPVRIM